MSLSSLHSKIIELLDASSSMNEVSSAVTNLQIQLNNSKNELKKFMQKRRKNAESRKVVESGILDGVVIEKATVDAITKLSDKYDVEELFMAQVVLCGVKYSQRLQRSVQEAAELYFLSELIYCYEIVFHLIRCSKDFAFPPSLRENVFVFLEDLVDSSALIELLLFFRAKKQENVLFAELVDKIVRLLQDLLFIHFFSESSPSNLVNLYSQTDVFEDSVILIALEQGLQQCQFKNPQIALLNDFLLKLSSESMDFESFMESNDIFSLFVSLMKRESLCSPFMKEKLRFLISRVIVKHARCIKQLKAIEEKTEGQNGSFLNLLSLIGDLYMDENVFESEEESAKFTMLFRWSSDSSTPSIIEACLGMMSKLCHNEFNAYYFLDFLRNSKGILSLDSFLSALEKYKSAYEEDRFERKISPIEMPVILMYLKVLAMIADSSEASRIILYESSNLVSILFSLYCSRITINIKTNILGIMKAFCNTRGIAAQLSIKFQQLINGNEGIKWEIREIESKSEDYSYSIAILELLEKFPSLELETLETLESLLLKGVFEKTFRIEAQKQSLLECFVNVVERILTEQNSDYISGKSWLLLDLTKTFSCTPFSHMASLQTPLEKVLGIFEFLMEGNFADALFSNTFCIAGIFFFCFNFSTKYSFLLKLDDLYGDRLLYLLQFCDKLDELRECFYEKFEELDENILSFCKGILMKNSKLTSIFIETEVFMNNLLFQSDSIEVVYYCCRMLDLVGSKELLGFLKAHWKDISLMKEDNLKFLFYLTSEYLLVESSDQECLEYDLSSINVSQQKDVLLALGSFIQVIMNKYDCNFDVYYQMMEFFRNDTADDLAELFVVYVSKIISITQDASFPQNLFDRAIYLVRCCSLPQQRCLYYCSLAELIMDRKVDSSAISDVVEFAIADYGNHSLREGQKAMILSFLSVTKSHPMITDIIALIMVDLKKGQDEMCHQRSKLVFLSSCLNEIHFASFMLNNGLIESLMKADDYESVFAILAQLAIKFPSLDFTPFSEILCKCLQAENASYMKSLLSCLFVIKLPNNKLIAQLLFELCEKWAFHSSTKHNLALALHTFRRVIPVDLFSTAEIISFIKVLSAIVSISTNQDISLACASVIEFLLANMSSTQSDMKSRAVTKSLQPTDIDSLIDDLKVSLLPSLPHFKSILNKF